MSVYSIYIFILKKACRADPLESRSTWQHTHFYINNNTKLKKGERWNVQQKKIVLWIYQNSKNNQNE